MSDHTLVPPRQHRHAPREVRGAWWCVASAPVALVVGFVGGEAVAAALGYTDEGAAPPWWVGGLALLTFVLAIAVPTAIAWRLHLRASARGENGAAVPAYVLTVLTAGVLALNLFSWLMRVLFE